MNPDELFQLLSEHNSFLMAVQQLGLPSIALEELPSRHRAREYDLAVQRNQRRIEAYPHRAELVEALRGIVRECRSGHYTRADMLGDLADAPHLGIELAALGCTCQEVREWHRSFAVQYVRTLLDACRGGQHEKIEELLNWMKVIMVAQPWERPIALQELGTSEEELERFRRVKFLLL